DMQGNRNGTNNLSAEEIITIAPNRFFGMPMQPPTLRVVPTQMTMDMHMFGVMYAPNDRLTLMAMANYLIKEMDHLTFAGPMGTTELGTFTTRSEGLGDTTVTALLSLKTNGRHQFHFNAGLSLPTGDIEEEDAILTPMGARPVVRLPYAMQLGSGTFDLKPGITYRALRGKISWGGQAAATLRLGENDEDYTLGDRYEVTAWTAYDWSDKASTSFRLSAWTQSRIDGLDDQIVAPVQTADPANYGGDVVEASIGFNYQFVKGPLAHHRLAIEASLPVYRDLNGPQLETDWTVTVGWQYGF
ncbi:MAG: transporter, partial [Gammaproteobacteria bacterium]|nr:transporter [Gammaproteobacteria bacterium]